MPAPKGSWEDGPGNSRVTAVHAILLHTGQVLIFHCRAYPMWSRLYDPYTNLMSADNQVVPIWPVVYKDPEEPENNYPIQPSAIFCSGHCAMADGRILVAGGEMITPYPEVYLEASEQPVRGLRYSFIFDPDEEAWEITGPVNSPHIMDFGRWYPTLTILQDGRILTVGGLSNFVTEDFKSLINNLPEIYDIESVDGWLQLSAQSALMPKDISYSYPDAHIVPTGSIAGKVFYATTQLVPDSQDPPVYYDGYSQIFNPSPAGSESYWTPLNNRRATPSEGSAGVLLPIRKGDPRARILLTGGWWVNPLDRADYIDLSDSSYSNLPQWNSITPMTHARINHNVVILPDRTLMVIGGEDSQGSVLIPELLDTDTLTWISDFVEPSEMEIGRNYHSTALLLPNAKVMLAGGRVADSGDLENDTERRITLFKPGYLSDGAQPAIISETPFEINYGGTFVITLDGSYQLDSMALIRPGSVTHGNNME